MGIKFKSTPFICDCVNETHMNYLGKRFTDGSYVETLCIPHLEEERPYCIALGNWGLIIMISGVLGNICTV